MIKVHHMAAQGDVLFRRVQALPDDVREHARTGPVVVAHSETGHHHVVDSPDAKLFTSSNPLVCYLRMEGAFADVVHQRPLHTHDTLRLLGAEPGPSYYEVRRQREFVPREKAQDEDEDEWRFAGD